MFVTSTFCGDFISLFITSVIVLIAYSKWMLEYWKRQNLPYIEPQNHFTNALKLFGSRQQPGIKIKSLYDEMKQNGWKHGGFYGFLSPIYLPVDLNYLRNILIKDFRYFSDRGVYHNEDSDPLSAHLGNLTGLQWRNMRMKLTPTFTSGKMKNMFHTLVSCEGNLTKKIELTCKRKEPINIKKELECFTTDIIGSCAFGLECNSFENENSPFRVYGSKFFERPLGRHLIRQFADTFPNVGRFLNIATVPQDVTNFFVKTVEDMVKYREKNNIVRNDFMQLLIDLKNNNFVDDDGSVRKNTSLTIKEITAQSFVFFAAGLETSSTTMTFALYELCKNQSYQDKLRNEIKTVLERHKGEITYDAIQEMHYLNQVINESLRKYPPAPLITRKCVQDYRVPGTDVIIEKGTRVMIPIYAVHRDQDNYPEPEKFDPERFNEKNKSLRDSCAFIPFGEGPRMCIGMRFGLMEAKVGLVVLLKNYKFTVNEKTKEPLQMNPDFFTLVAEGDIWLDAHQI